MDSIALSNIKYKKEYKRDRNWAYKQIIKISKKYNEDKNNEKKFCTNILRDLHEIFNNRYPDENTWKYKLKEKEYRRFKFNVASDYAKNKYLLEHSNKKKPVKKKTTKVKNVQKKISKNKIKKKKITYLPVPKRIMDKIEYKRGFNEFLKNKDNKFQITWTCLNNAFNAKEEYFNYFLRIAYKYTKLFRVLILENVCSNSLSIKLWGYIKSKEYLNRIIGFKKKSIIIPLLLLDNENKKTHANVIIINQVKKIIYHFEPHGIFMLNIKYTFKIDQCLFNFFKPLYKEGYVFKSYFLDTFFSSSGIEYSSLLSGYYNDFYLLIEKKYYKLYLKYKKRYKRLILQKDLPFCIIYSFYVGSLLINNVHNTNIFMLIKQNIKHLDFKILTFMYYIYIITHGKNDKYNFYKSITNLDFKEYFKDKNPLKKEINKIINNYNLYKKLKKGKKK